MKASNCDLIAFILRCCTHAIAFILGVSAAQVSDDIVRRSAVLKYPQPSYIH